MWSFLFSPGSEHRAAHHGEARSALFRWCRAALGALLVLTACSPAPDLVLTEGWVRAMPPGAPMAAAYGTFEWRGDRPLVIAAWYSDEYAAVDLHRTVRHDGLSRMEPVAQPVIPAGGRLTLEPGGMHLMLMTPGRNLQPGDTVGITLQSDNGRSFRFDFPVLAR